MKFLNWLLYEVHRWLGIAVGIFMFVWFLTGLVIMYSTPTTQTPTQQLAHAEILAVEPGWLSLGDVWQHSEVQRKLASNQRAVKKESNSSQKQKQEEPAITDARLVRINGEPLWLVDDTRNQRFALSANDGALREFSEAQSLQIAQSWYKAINEHDVPKVRYLELVDSPIILRNQESLRPFHHIAVGEAGDELLISSRTGEVLHASTRLERAFFWAGNWIHLFKPLEALGYGSIRHDVQLWSSLIATIATLTGLIIGWLRWRPGFNGKRTYSEGRTQPYREFWFKWHFWTGLLGGTLALFWALSGFIDTNPGKLFSQGDYTREELNHYLDNALPEVMSNSKPIELIGENKVQDLVQLNWRRLGNEAVLLAYGRDGVRIPQIVGSSLPQFSSAALVSGVNRVQAITEMETTTLLNEYDSYYYPRHHQTKLDKPLPVLLVKLSDEAATRFYLDPQDGRLLSKFDKSRRILRWLYSALHHWDFGWLYYRPLWDIWMIIWVSCGLVLGASSLVIGWRRLKKTLAPKKHKARRPAFISELVTENVTD
ncbi:PepSY domain-containing protein [Methylomonas sp. AM2-LC]|uniref:PepSY domain-containing protein n=1 Tax=Methylomonas sp. AM2-LC TaxID=3153301 RepID=UPI00326502AA